MTKRQFYKKAREVHLECKKCTYNWSVEVTNIYDDEIEDMFNCPNCGHINVEIKKIKMIK